MKVKLSFDEAVILVDTVVREEGGDPSFLTPVQKAQAVQGVIRMVDCLQVLGFRISRPLFEVKNG